jgi:hypothetical protein
VRSSADLSQQFIDIIEANPPSPCLGWDDLSVVLSEKLTEHIEANPKAKVQLIWFTEILCATLRIQTDFFDTDDSMTSGGTS